MSQLLRALTKSPTATAAVSKSTPRWISVMRKMHPTRTTSLVPQSSTTPTFMTSATTTTMSCYTLYTSLSSPFSSSSTTTMPTYTQQQQINTNTQMSNNHIIVTDETTIDTAVTAAFQQAKEQNKQLYVYITGAVVPETGKSWCPDCVSAVPFVNVLKNEANNAVVVECPVERARYRGVPVNCDGEEGCKIQKHVYKTHPMFKVTSIPTLYKFNMADATEVPARLVEVDVYNAQKIAAFTGVDKAQFEF